MGKLTSEIEKRREKIEEEFLSAVSSLGNKEELESRIEQLRTEWEGLQKYVGRSKKPSLLYRIFRPRAYKAMEEERASKCALSDEIGKKIDEGKKGLKSRQSRVEELEDEKSLRLSELDDLHKMIGVCVSDDPSLLEDSEFLKSCVDVDLSKISMATTSDDRVADDVFIHFLKLYKGKFLDIDELKSKGYSEERIKVDRGAVDYVISELRDPKPVDEGKYKIPHRYLREKILSSFDLFYESYLLEKKSSITQSFMTSVAKQYIDFDGEFDISHGMDLERVYDDSSMYLYMHDINYTGSFYGDAAVAVCESICEEGLKLPHPANEFGDPGKTTINTDSDRYMTAMDFMEYWKHNLGIVVLQVPRDIVDDKKGYIGWRDKESGGVQYDALYMLPEYVVGYIHNGGFVPNPIDLDQRVDSRSDFSQITTDATRTDIFSFRKNY